MTGSRTNAALHRRALGLLLDAAVREDLTRLNQWLHDNGPVAGLFPLAASHGLIPAVLPALAKQGGLAYLSDHAAWREYLHRQLALRDLTEDLLHRVGAAFSAAGIQAVSIRAWGQTAQAYPTPEQRLGRDVDLLVPSENAETACTVLTRLGLIEKPTRTHLVFGRGPVHLDLARRPTDFLRQTDFPGEDQTFPRLDGRWRDHVVEGRIQGLQQFDPPMEFLLNALHAGYKHRFSLLIWLLDLAWLACRMTADQWQTLRTLAAEAQATFLVEAALRWSRDWLDTPGLRQGEAALAGAASRGSLLPRHILRCCSRRPTSRPCGYLLAWCCSPSPAFRTALWQRAASLPDSQVQELAGPSSPPKRWDRWLTWPRVMAALVRDLRP